MTDLSDLLAPELVLADVSVATKKALFLQIASKAAPIAGIDAKHLARGLADRERLGSTGYGAGVAIPHAKVEGVARPMGVVAKLAQAIDYKAMDDLPVDLAFALFSPPNSGVDHLKALARVANSLRQRDFVARLRGAASGDALYAVLNGDDAAR